MDTEYIKKTLSYNPEEPVSSSLLRPLKEYLKNEGTPIDSAKSLHTLTTTSFHCVDGVSVSCVERHVDMDAQLLKNVRIKLVSTDASLIDKIEGDIAVRLPQLDLAPSHKQPWS